MRTEAGGGVMGPGLAAPGPERSIAFAACLLGAVVIGWNLVAMFLTGPYAWDDGAITLAYARTLAEHGRFALTPASEVVEGSSSLLFTMLMAILHRASGFGFEQFILASQLVSLMFLVLTLALVHVGLREAIRDSGQRLFVVCLFGLLPAFTAEILNGMEMSLTAFLMAAYYLAYGNGSRWVFAVIPLLLLARFEAVFYIVLSLGILFLVQKPERGRIVLIAGCTMAAFLAITAFRWMYFGDVLPNTIWAKMNPPYSIAGSLPERLVGKLSGAIEFIWAAGFLVLAALVAYLLQDRAARRKSTLGILLIAAFGAFAAIAGSNWGYPGRMFLASLPLALLVAGAGAVDGAARTLPWPKAGGSRRGPRLTTFRLLAWCLVGAHLSNANVYAYDLKAVLRGAYYRDMLPDAASSILREHVQPASFGVTPANYRVTGNAVEGIRGILGTERIDFMSPDVGGLGLCCGNINVIDLALLTNSFLARNGYGALDGYISRVRPDVIQTHELWSLSSGIYSSGYFRANYQPAVFENNLFWIRSDNLASLLRSGIVEVHEIRVPEGLQGVRYAGSPVDLEYLDHSRVESMWSLAAR